jgi:GTPase SAR1 family protein
MTETKKSVNVEERTIAIVGGGGVGKSSITVQFIKHLFDEVLSVLIQWNTFTNSRGIGL